VVITKKLFELLKAECYPNGQRSLYLLGVVNFLLNFAIGAVITSILAPLSLIFPVHILVKRRSSELKLSFMVEELEGTLRQHLCDGTHRRAIFIGPYYSQFPNTQLAQMYGEFFLLLNLRNKRIHRFIDYVWPILKIRRHKVLLLDKNFLQLWESSEELLKFSSEEVRKGHEYLRTLLGNEKKQYVTFCAGSQKYREKIDFGLEKFVRPLSIIELDQYLGAFNLIKSEGFDIVRFGKFEEGLADNLKELLIDSCETRSDFTDAFLNSRCRFVLSGVSGGWWLSAPFNKPVALTNSPWLLGTSNSSSLFIPRIPWLIEEQRFASFSWQIKNFDWSANLTNLGVVYESSPNSSSQIIDLVEEMLKRLDGEWHDSSEDLELQARFKRLQEDLPSHLRTSARIGAKFLREHQHLLP